MTGLAYILEQMHYPNKDLAKDLSVPPASVSTWVNGKVDIPEKHMTKLVNITHVNQTLIAMKELRDKDKVLISLQLASAEDPWSEKVRYLEAQYRTLTFLDEVDLYINTHGMKKMESGAILVDKENNNIQVKNIRRLERLFELAKTFDDKAIDSILNGIERITHPEYFLYEEEEKER